MKKYMVYLDDGEHLMKILVPAESKRAATAFCQGNGEVVTTKDVTDEYHISIDKVANALKAAGFGEPEIELITHTLIITNIAD